ncbi:hypothetical protein ACNKHV_26060 [Shigella flexneri]
MTPTLSTRFLRLWSVLKKTLAATSEFKYRSGHNEDGIIPQLQAVAEAEARLNAQPHGASLYLPMEGLTAIAMPLRRCCLVRTIRYRNTARSNHSNPWRLRGIEAVADFLNRYSPESGVGVSDLTWKTT